MVADVQRQHAAGQALSGSGKDDVWAAASVLLHWNGSAWSALTRTPSADLAGVLSLTRETLGGRLERGDQPVEQ